MTTTAPGAVFTLADRLAHPARMTPVEVAVVGRQVAVALADRHRRGEVHRAVAPEALAVRRDDDGGLTVRLLPAGAARPDPSWAAPEVAAGRPVGPAADVWSLGTVLLTCLVGRRVEPPVVPADLGAAWRHLLLTMTAASPADRPTAERVAATLAGVPGVTGAPGQVQTPTTAGPAPTPPRSKLLPGGAHVEPVPIELPGPGVLHRLPLVGRRRPPEPDVRH